MLAGVRLPLCATAILCITSVYAVAKDVPAREAARTLPLSGNDWRICADPDGKGKDRRMFEADASTPEWTVATVPGNIQADLEAAHCLKPLWYGNGDPRLEEVAQKDWWYRKDFRVPEAFAAKRVALVFDGVDFECEVWLNGKQVGSNVGMFRRFQFDVADILRPGQNNRLAVRIAKMPQELSAFYSRAKENGVYDGVFWDGINRTRQWFKELKSPTNSGWDWGINIWTLGIWKDVRLVATDPTRIDDVRVRSSLNSDFSKAVVSVALEVDSLDARPVQARFRVAGNGQEATIERKLSLAKGRNAITADIPLDKPALWWPNGQGLQPLYTVSTEIVSADGAKLDARQTRFGIRDVRWVHTENAPANFVSRFQLIINGRPVRTMGSNLIPPDLLFGRADARSLRLLHLAKAAGMNTLRHWGGGVPLSDRFYDLADELGIMLSFEFPLANVWPEADAAFLGNLDNTIRNVVKQVRNHPSIVEYTGGNEMLWNSETKHPALDVMRKVVAEEDGRVFRATCPDLGARHGPHNFQIGETYRHYNTVETMRYGEFGTSSPANLEVWHRDIPPKSQEAVSRFDDPVLVHKNVVQGAFGLQDWLYKPRIDEVFGDLKELRLLVEAGQFLGAEQIRYAFDALRRKGKRIGGFTNWDFNEPWPNGAGSYMVDYDGRTLLNYDLIKQSLAPVSLSLSYDTMLYTLEKGVQAELFVTSDAPRKVAGLRWEWLARDRRGNAFARGQGEATLEPGETKSLAKLNLKPPASTAHGPVFVELRLEDEHGKAIGERIHIFGMAGVKAPLAGLLQNGKADSDDDAVDAKSRVELPDGPKNLAFVGNGAKPATASSSRPEPNHQAKNLNDGRFGNENSWIGTTPQSSFQIDLGKPALIGRFKLGRDRTGNWSDRLIDYLKIETSLDGKSWQTAYEKRGLASLAAKTGSTQSTILRVKPVRAQQIRVTVDPEKPAEGMFACVDEFEVYAAEGEPAAGPPRMELVDARPNISAPVRRTSLAATASPVRFEDGEEVFDLQLKNTGAMTALFCEPHPLIEYRTDLFIDGNHNFIPPGESRTMTIKAAKRAGGLSLAQTGWRISCWNADDVTMESSDDVLLAVGRRDQMCREYLGYVVPSEAVGVHTAFLEGTRPDTAKLPYLLDKGKVARFEFPLSDAQAKRAARLRIHAADQAAASRTMVAAVLNGRRIEGRLPTGLGIQHTDPAHLAFPATVEFEVPATNLRPGKNVLEVHVEGDGWFSWDALDLVAP